MSRKYPVGPSGRVYNNIGEWQARDHLGLHNRKGWREEMDRLTERYGLWREWETYEDPLRGGYWLYDSQQITELVNLWIAQGTWANRFNRLVAPVEYPVPEIPLPN